MKDILLCFINVFLMVCGQIILKYGIKDKTIGTVPDIIKALFSPVIFSGLCLYAGSVILWLYILNKLPLSLAYPIQALAFPIVLVLTSMVFGEVVSLSKWIGVFIIVLGVFITTK